MEFQQALLYAACGGCFMWGWLHPLAAEDRMLRVVAIGGSIAAFAAGLAGL